MKRILLILRIKLVLSFFLFLNTPIFAQNITPHFYNQNTISSNGDKCATPLVEAQQLQELGLFGSKEYFESWINDKIESRKKSLSLRTAADEVRVIPVVVHVIHNGEAIGNGANIPLSQIEAQIRILNEDFRRQNADAANTPDEFQGVAVDAQIEFVLAKQDPRGLPTSGINRVQGTKAVYSQSDASLVSSFSYWDSNDYLNLWVVPMQSPYIGYASFPISDLDGLNFSPSSKETDGVTIDYRYFGSGGNASSSSLGRTATHEIGHFFGLRHIWGDGDCSVDDFVDDTPNQESSNNACNSTVRTTCGSRDMIQNYMDYTPDACMNLFTAGQLERFDVVLANSPRRVSLVNGRAAQEPEVFALDLALDKIIVPQDYICSNTVTPQVEAFNAGTTALTSAVVAISLNGSVMEQKTFTFDLDQGDDFTFTFDPIDIQNDGNEFEVNVISVNNITDENPGNNLLTSSPIVQPNLALPYTYSSGDINGIWSVRNDDEGITWNQEQLTLDGTSQEALLVNFYNYETDGEMDYLITPQINLSNTPNAQLTFKMAYATYPEDGLEDRLLIGISTDCGNTFDLVNAPYDKSQETLETASSTSNEFIPTSESAFRTEVVDLSEYADYGNIRIAFIAVNGYGNNLYIKDIAINTDQVISYGFKIDEVLSPSPITDGSQENEVLNVTNTGTLVINSFLLDRTINGSEQSTLIADDITLNPNETITVELPNALTDGLNGVQYTIFQPNFDQNQNTQSSLIRYYYQDDAEVAIPWRQNFDNNSSISPWVSVNPESGETSWELVSKETGESGDNLANLREQSNENSYWIGTPVMDLSSTSRASVFFDRAASGVDSNTQMTVLFSQDGGVTFTEELTSFTGEELNTINGEAPVNPNTPSEFVREFIDLSDYTGSGFEKVRLAFVVENGNSETNPVYLDNIEFYLENNPEPVNPGLGNAKVYPNPATDLFNIVFNLDDFEDVRIQVISSSGQMVHDVIYPGTLNQTYSFSTEVFAKGVFIIKIQSDDLSLTKRLIIR
ncbi:M43 family zinc metalloprotease [Echinicola sp. 20G]|uniref:zinc-dependent metalloprotease n=1 Tax=Echinicola sp. 20G TaxID=2781961 RepID=UPI00190FDC10|nr:M43 family zinc metalloprotease [Echinicola sp. 20G]